VVHIATAGPVAAAATSPQVSKLYRVMQLPHFMGGRLHVPVVVVWLCLL
jgi:hypothetical protein